VIPVIPEKEINLYPLSVGEASEERVARSIINSLLLGSNLL
jgi:hypothetical protein